jgi:hypothetical protein
MNHALAIAVMVAGILYVFLSLGFGISLSHKNAPISSGLIAFLYWPAIAALLLGLHIGGTMYRWLQESEHHR